MEWVEFTTNEYPVLLKGNIGCAVPDGWGFYVKTLLDALVFEQESDRELAGFRVKQIKEKFGTLRFYCVGGDDFTNAIIDRAEEASAHTCEITGLPGSLHTMKNSMWLKTINPEYANEHGYAPAYIKF